MSAEQVRQAAQEAAEIKEAIDAADDKLDQQAFEDFVAETAPVVGTTLLAVVAILATLGVGRMMGKAAKD